MPPFIIYALPRSRTAWLARYLTYGDWHCGHEEILHVRSLDDVRSWLSMERTGTAETAGAPWWRTIYAIRPDIRTVVIRRPVDEVLASARAIPGALFDMAALTRITERLDRKLDQIEARVPNLISVRYSDLANEDTCAAIFEHCLPYRHDRGWWAMLDRMDVQVDVARVMAYAEAHKRQFQSAVRSARHAALDALYTRSYPLPVGRY